jgi:hypothetical protein
MITQDNVVILRVNFLDHDQTELFFVVTKDSHVQTPLSQDVLMEPTKIKYILSAQIGPLSRVLGGVHIHELQLDEVHRLAPLDNDNTKMVNLVILVLTLLAIIYIIAIYRCLKQTVAKRRLKRRREKEQKYGPSYGTCTEKLLTDYERTNGKPRLASIPSHESIVSASGRKLTKTSEIVRTPTLKTPTYDDDRPSLDARSFNRMFACDPSQLPAEYHRQSAEQQQDDDSVNILMPSPPSSAKSMLPTKEDPIMPSVILVSSGTPDFIAPQPVPKIEMLVDSPEPFSSNQQESTHASVAASLLETNPTFNPYERPLSRRGSRNSTPEEGEEYVEDDREDTPPPLGDEAIIAEKLENLPNADAPVARSHTAHKFGHWSSDEDSENEVYQRLSEVSEGEEGGGDFEESTKRKKRKIQKNASSDLESVTSDEEEKGIDEEEALERHQYERLQESPTHTKPLPDMSLELDSALQ